MPEIQFTIDSASGELQLHLKGIAGPACDDVAKLAKELLGQPAAEQTTAEYHLRTQVRPQVQTRRS
ncbi:MAG TPA: DUF2997 domain-containing protein [Chloroflexota bacterium]|nr:DUF2997 domain-containing protein [Chloroflexota bacterium]